MSLQHDIKVKLSNLNVFEKLIVINVIVFVALKVLNPWQDMFFGWFELPIHFSKAFYKPWTIITYAFMHYNFWHILFNMLWLYFLGRIFVNLFSPKLALNIYFLGAISGGFLFLIGYSFFPSFFEGSLYPLVGASAAIRALLIFLCAYMPNKEMRLFTFNLKLWYIGVALVVLDVLGLYGGNGGGNLAHLGGVILGYYYAKQLLKGKDIGKRFEGIMDRLSSWFSSAKKSNLKTVHKNKSKVGGYNKGDFKEFNNQKQVDVILDKISKSGYDSLTSEEKEFLFRAGK